MGFVIAEGSVCGSGCGAGETLCRESCPANDALYLSTVVGFAIGVVCGEMGLVSLALLVFCG